MNKLTHEDYFFIISILDINILEFFFAISQTQRRNLCEITKKKSNYIIRNEKFILVIKLKILFFFINYT